MPREHSRIIARAQPSQGPMTPAEIVALFDRRQIAYGNLGAATLAEDYADDCLVESPAGGTHTGRPAGENVLKGIFDAFLDLKLAAVFLYEFRDRHIVRERRIYDFTGMLTQIGVLKTKAV